MKTLSTENGEFMASKGDAFERFICPLFGGKRRGPDFRDDEGKGKNDCIQTPGYSIECKNWGRPFFQMMLDEAIRAEDRRECPEDIPVAIIKRKYDRNENSLVVMRLFTFLDHFGPGVEENDIEN
jgi:hypothetical protein